MSELLVERFAAGAHGYVWRAQAPLGALVLVHGLQSHAGWFADAAEGLSARGLSVYALDRRGSGSSPGVRGDIGRYGEWLDEIDAALALAAREHEHVHLLGHCFGANLALACALRTPVRSLTMLTPGLHVLPRYSPAVRARVLAAALAAPTTRFPVPQRDEQFTRDPDVLAWIRADRQGARTLTARALIEAERLARHVRRDVGKLRAPLLVLEARHDRISDNRRNRARLEAALGTRWRRVELDAEHFLLAEPCRDEALDAIASWTAITTSHTRDQLT
jgi:alpha-beta hydrolase superfamily lysophospholipase